MQSLNSCSLLFYTFIMYTYTYTDRQFVGILGLMNFKFIDEDLFLKIYNKFYKYIKYLIFY